MKYLLQLLTVITFFLVIGNSSTQAQNCDILYFCVKYDEGEVDCSDRFTTGKITVMVRLAAPIYYTKVYIQADKYDPRSGTFKYYKDYDFTTDPEMTYIYFNNIEFAEKGFYRVFLLSPNKETITSAVVEII